MANNELKPCPMPDCGSTLVGTGKQPCGVATVCCGHCGVSVPGDGSVESAILYHGEFATLNPIGEDYEATP